MENKRLEDVTLTMAEQVLIGLGSNLSSPMRQIQTAIENIQLIPSVMMIRQSSFYESCPQGPQDQANFINCVVQVEYGFSAQKLLLALQNIEQQQGRIKKRHWGERTIDLDILFYGQQNIKRDGPDLIIPHPQALLRDFVVLPTLEIAPDWQLPDGSMLEDYLEQCLNHQIRRIATINY